ncbi:hypothetical protein EWM64_g10374 [Hericium alpestre]|uniref:Anaphase-promoting complex subunit 4 WD40 domain-containing protein n=1 Tax=Hericium alpestre TaxID=135208 RepID=A0A4Y9ZJM2_9AGAM|nr:hypothetical protein EWM64_g10374 [Hericium alpestre]
MADHDFLNPSLSQTVLDANTQPSLMHTLQQANNSVLSIAADGRYIYSGSQSTHISVYDNETFALKTNLRGHTGSVLALEYAADKQWLFSSSGDSTIRIWCTLTHSPIYVLHPHLDTESGDLFSIAWSRSLKTLYIGCQNTSLQWYYFPDEPTPDHPCQGPTSGTSTPSRKAHRLGDLSSHIAHPTVPEPRSILSIPASNVIDSAHFGYVYCMTLVPSTREGSDDLARAIEGQGNVHLVTGSGDETLKLWLCAPEPKLLHTFECQHGAVLSLATREELVYAGCQDGYVKVWDTQTRTLVRTIIVHENVDVLSLSVLHSDVYTFSANGQVNRYSDTFDCTASWRAHDGIILSSIISRDHNAYRLLTGGNDGAIKVWNIQPPRASYHRDPTSPIGIASPENDVLIYALRKFVSIPSVSGPAHREDCRQAAIWLAKCLHQLGAQAKTLSTGDDTNPIVFATFHGARPLLGSASRASSSTDITT